MLILLKLAGFIFWLWWIVLVPLLMLGVFGMIAYLLAKKELKKFFDREK